MLRIRRIYDEFLPINKDAIRQVQEIMRNRFPGIREEEIEQIAEHLSNPFKQRFRTILFVAENARHRVLGFAILLHDPEIGFCYLDWLATARGKTGGGLGGALYDRVRQEAGAFEVRGIFLECLPDDPKDCPDPKLLVENSARLRFYEQYGARPIIDTAYETPISPEDTCLPYLVYDGIDPKKPLTPNFARKVVRAILERKYGYLCPPEYVEKVVHSFQSNPVKLRVFRYVKPSSVVSGIQKKPREAIALVVNERHDIHQIHERGYVESPVRIRSILKEIEPSGIFERVKTRNFPDQYLHAVHDVDFVSYIRRACEQIAEGKSLYPYVFPIRNKTRPPKESSVLPGYYCIDTFTPINRNAYPAARNGVNCSLTAAHEILGGRRITYALVRPPGHHAERRAFGGFCYFNNNAIAAEFLRAYGRVAILDIDYHHGNGQQDIFYRRSDVLTVSIHGHPNFAYPYFTGFEDEYGEGEGEGFNLNIPLPESVNGEQYRKALLKALDRIQTFKPDFLIVALGLDTAKGDPTGTWTLQAKDFHQNGQLIGDMEIPVLVIQEGGYKTQTLGSNARHFFEGLIQSSLRSGSRKGQPEPRIQGLTFRYEAKPEDVERIRKMVEDTGFFRQDEVLIAIELVQERLNKGAESGYHFIFSEQNGKLIGYCCYGRIGCTVSSYDLYWIVVSPDVQGKGLGKLLMKETEKQVRIAGGTRIYIETSQRSLYAGTRAFYQRCNYRLQSILDDFYAPGDAKAIYVKLVA